MQRRDFFKAGASLAIALTELIIPATDTPGVKAARVNRYLDLFLRDGAPTQRQSFLEGLVLKDLRGSTATLSASILILSFTAAPPASSPC